MLYARASKVEYSYSGSPDLALRDLNFSIGPGSRTGIAGLNGSGKTTALRLIAGEISPLAGYFWKNPETTVFSVDQNLPDFKDISLGVLPAEALFWLASPVFFKAWLDTWHVMQGDAQDPFVFEKFDNFGGYAIIPLMARFMARWGVDPELLERPVASLSGGECTRIRLAGAGALASINEKRGVSTLLLLDEPTNHLDIHGREILAQWLADDISTSSAFVLISHDRSVLDHVCSRIWDFDNGRMVERKGNFTEAMTIRMEQENRARRENEADRKKLINMEKAVRVRRTMGHSMEKFKLPRSVTKKGRVCKRDDGAGHGKVRSKGVMGSASALEKRMDRIRESMNTVPVQPKKYRLRPVQPQKMLKGTVLRVENLSMSYGESPLFERVTFELPAGGVLAVQGPNGSGKSTLLSILADRIKPQTGRVRWLPGAEISWLSQTANLLENRGSILQVTGCSGKAEEGALRNLLGAMRIKGDSAHIPLEKMSAGQYRKALLAGMQVSAKSVLLLDEPENHIETMALEALEEAIIDFQGTIIMVTHDSELISRTATHCLFLQNKLWTIAELQ
ncbi:MAG: hypothetical protein CVV64_14335 [Candidatus Wallbacteria bacterium HGW-Wallbacteria-1]|uniref:ABC transporter domain-containing protein n=1 Tax=Candidatus Wallbacteria bacterium HGW-Wallbacteria-1 TaxID=2013854 RepID=A0A2N1PM85_9BACT|nr:MAG: hypothetical protein CVV64_14335 [Candidatus Wallbacteria bacterium HGW-Wallbacteria-1]